ncbi:hypothetical protein ZIOFF_011059 [Zingiber officinale]|uniref:Uncharacterized protein n=1 Tax=Zingiber officinale TaxID=94328 RepID=A0A8J5HWW4_ZINOF|nr:hypothetical protein ZIOFF_011059 [Zingiber officinale]
MPPECRPEVEEATAGIVGRSQMAAVAATTKSNRGIAMDRRQQTSRVGEERLESIAVLVLAMPIPLSAVSLNKNIALALEKEGETLDETNGGFGTVLKREELRLVEKGRTTVEMGLSSGRDERSSRDGHSGGDEAQP